MEAASRWLRSFYADKVKIQHSRSAITCGETALLCSIELTNPNSKFKDYHENKITVFNRDKNAVAVEDCEFYITEVNSRQLDVHCYARCAGRATVRLDLGKWYQFEDQDINVDIVPSTPKYLRNVDVCFYQRPMDEEHRPDKMGTLYYGIKSLLKFEVLDKNGNLIEEVRDERDYDIMIAYCDNNVLYSLKWKMRSGTIFAIFLPKLIGIRQMVVHFVDKRSNSMQESIFPHRMSINILHPPCSPFLTLKFLDDNLEQSCTAGKGLIFEVQIYDIFGNPVLKDSNETCEIDVHSPTLKTAVKQHGKEQVNIRKIITRENLSFVVTVCFKISGFRKVRLIVKSGSKSCSKDIYVMVLPSTPHHLNNVKFTTNGVINESFSADPTVMYRNQWSILEADLVDCYDNVVRELTNDYNISLKLFNDKGKETQMEYKDAEIRNERLRVQIKINQAGKDNLLITLTHKSFPDQEFHLKGIQIHVNDAPLYLAGSKFRYPDTVVAGKEIELEILPFDVFGCRLPACTSTDYNLPGAISNSPSEVNENKETMDFKTINNESNVVICVAIVLKRAGRRKVMIFDKDNKDQDINVDIVPSSPKYIRNVEVNRFQKPVDEKHRSDEIRALYYGVKSLLEFEVVDEYENFIEQIRDKSCYDVTIEYSDNNVLYRLEWRMRNGTILATFLPKLVGERQMIVRLVDKRLNSMKVSTCTYQMLINILCAPCSPSLTLKFLDDNLEQRCTAGKDFIFQVHFYDIFGNPVHKDFKETCDIVVQAAPSKTEGKQYRKEQVNVKKNIASEDLSFAATVCFETAGLKKVKFTVNSDSKSCSKDIYVMVLPSTPHHLNNVKFTTNGVINESFSADPTVMYRNQWSILEADLVDCYDNVVRELTNDYNISLKLFNDKGKETQMEYKDAEIRNERLRVQIKINQAGKDNLLITLTHKSFPDQDFHLKEIQIHVNDAPLYLAGSKFRYPDTGVAGKEIELEILPFDVFGCRLPACTSTDYNLTGAISNSPSEVNENKETMDFKTIKNESNVVICVAIVLRRAGRRKVMIFDKDNKDQDINVDIVPSSPKYIRNVEVNRFQKPVDEKHRSDEIRALYYGVKSLLEFEVVDEYENFIEQIRDKSCYDVTIEYSDNNVLYRLEWRMRNGTILATFLPKLVGERQMIVRLVDKRLNSMKVSTCTYQMLINILCAPCSPSLTLKFLDDNLEQRCTAGKDFIFQVHFYDIFGNPVHKDFKETCDIVVQAAPSKTEGKQYRKEQVNVKKNIASEDLSFAATVCFETAGLKKVKFTVNSGSKSCSKDIYVMVLPSTPHHLNNVKFTTNGVINESFSADPTVMYRNQWSILEADLVDCYDNVVRELTNDYNISLKLFNDKGKETQMEYKDAEIRNERLRVQIKINQAGKDNLLITLTHKSFPDQEFHLKEIQIHVNDAPLYLAGSKFRYPDTGVAGKEIELEILPFDVFGCRSPANSTTDFSLTGDISNSPSEVNENKESMDFRIIKKESNIVICVAIVLNRAGSRKVMIFKKDNKAKKQSTPLHYQEINVNIVPSSPKYIRNMDVSRCQKPMAKKHRSDEMGTLYYGIKSLLKFEVLDKYGNLIEQIRDERCYDVTIEDADNNVLYPLEWRMRNGTILATFSPKLVGEGQLTVRLVDKRLNSKKESTCTYQMPINIHFPPCSPSLTLKSLHDNLEKRSSAGKDFIFEVQFYDVFGNPVHKDSKETCEVVVQPPPLKTAVEQHEKEEVNMIKINTTENLRFAVTVCFKIAGLRKVRLIVHSGSKSSSKDVYVKVLPSTPHYLNDVSFTTHGAIDESFSANPTVMYRNQRSILEGKLVDCYDNVVPELSADYNISLKLSNDMGKETQMEYKDAEIRNEQLHVQVMINETGKHKLSITLTHRNCPDQVFNLKEIQIQVNDAPLYLVGSKFCYSETAVAGKEIQLEILPLDVFGCSLPASSTTDCNLTAELLNPTLELNKDKETVDFKIIKNESNLIISVSIVLTKAGRRKVMIFDKYKKSTEVLIHVNPDRNDLLWELTAPKESAYRRENLILTARLFDRFKNEVRTDVLEDIPDLIKRDGPDGLYCTEKSMEDNKVTIQCHFNRAGKYDLCLADEGGISLEGTSFSITVQEAPLDYSCSSIIWLPQYDDIGDQPVFPEDESFRCCLKLKDVFGYSHAANIAEDCIKVEYDNKEVKNIKVSSCANEIGSYNIVVPLKNLVKGRQSPKFWCFINGIKIENPLVLPTFTGFEKYDDDQMCQLHEFLNIVCYGVKKGDIIGNDNINNIKRVCEFSGDLKVDELDDSNSALIRLPSEEIEYKLQGDRKIRCPPEEVENKIQKCRNILLHLLRATCYREKAFELDEAREEWKMRASENYRKIKEGECIGKDRPHFCSQIKEKYAALMKGYHDAACEEIFQFFNAERHQSEIDLHGLLVLDEKKLRGYERQLRSRGRLTSDEVNKKIEEERDHGNEAIRKLRERLDQYDMKKAKEEEEPWLEIIVGSGHHSKVRQQIRPKVEEYLGKEELEFSPVNKGALVVTFKPYAGRQPCFGEYYCPKCYRSWRNGRSWVDKWQACYKCHKEKESLEECFPLKQRPLRETQSYNPTKGQRSIPHLQELCGKCTELGRPCPRV